LPLETLLIFGTNRNALQEVIERLNQEGAKKKGQQLSLFVNEEAKKRRLLIPVYQRADRPLVEQGELAKFEITNDEFDLLRRYIDFIGDGRVLLAMYETEPKSVTLLKCMLDSPDRYFKFNGRRFKNIRLLMRQLFDYFGLVPEEFKQLKELEDEIKHFKHIQVSLKDISDLSRKVDTVRGYKDLSAVKAELMEKFKRGEISLEQYTEGIEQAARMVREEKVEYEGKRLRIKHIANHYYIPVILSDERKRIDYINHIIQTPSEVDFINHLERYLERVDNKFKEFDWWLFSKLDESLDEVYIPYYNPKTNRISQFKPDFIFWLQKGNDYFIIFVDPKGTAYTDYQHKIDGYRRVFEDNGGEKKVIPHEGLNVKVFSFLHTDDVGRLSEGYKDYWFDNMDQVLHHLLR